MANFPNYDFRGVAVPAGKDRAGAGGAPAAAAPAAAAPSAPKKEAAPAPKKEEAPKKEAKKEAAPAAAAAAPAAAASGGPVDEDAIKKVGDDIRVLKEKLKGEGITGKKLNEHPEIAALVAKLSELKNDPPKAKKDAAPAPAPAKKEKKEAAPAKDDAKAKAPASDPVADAKKKLKTVIKEGGKRGVEIEGAADMGGLQFFCTSVDAPEGDLDLVVECMNAMNAKSDPADEERKGGSGAIGKMIFSCCTEHLAVAAYVPEDKQGELSCEAWLKQVLSIFNGELVKGDKTLSIGKVKADGDKNVFPLKIREPMILEANNFLRKLGLFPEDNGSDDDEMVFGDDDFPS